ncbi:hypothetical protein EYF80_013234 [Liparis tanakae]|uniref:Uncharacterized protein n=1 Tax=Liparis tanakae TaxID=230148 RepID=A0A4Z2IGM3_9TELE|nr:hypothetical protein EYF80_013234 [Liparis tanakae]
MEARGEVVACLLLLTTILITNILWGLIQASVNYYQLKLEGTIGTPDLKLIASLARSSSCSFWASCTRSSVAESTSAEQPPWVSSRSLLNMSFICRSRCTSSWSWATSSRSRTATHRDTTELQPAQCCSSPDKTVGVVGGGEGEDSHLFFNVCIVSRLSPTEVTAEIWEHGGSYHCDGDPALRQINQTNPSTNLHCSKSKYCRHLEKPSPGDNDDELADKVEYGGAEATRVAS